MMNSGAHRPRHIFMSMQGRSPPYAYLQLQALRAKNGASEAQMTQANHKVCGWLLNNRDSLFGVDKTSATCMLHPGRACQVSLQVAPFPERSRPLTMGMIPPPCTPFTAMGKNNKWGHPHMAAVLVGLVGIGACNYDIVAVEESDRFPASLLEDMFPAKYKHVWLTFGPQDQCLVKC